MFQAGSSMCKGTEAAESLAWDVSRPGAQEPSFLCLLNLPHRGCSGPITTASLLCSLLPASLSTQQ